MIVSRKISAVILWALRQASTSCWSFRQSRVRRPLPLLSWDWSSNWKKYYASGKGWFHSWFGLVQLELKPYKVNTKIINFFITHPSSLTLHHFPLIPHPSSFTPHRSPLIIHPSSLIIHPSSLITHPWSLTSITYTSSLSPQLSSLTPHHSSLTPHH